MELVNLNYSTKNIPIPSNREYTTKLIEMTEKLLKRMRWKTFFFLHPEIKNSNNINTFGFKSMKTPPSIPELTAFEQGVKAMISNIQFSNTQCQFQQLLKEDIKLKIKSSKELLIPADKTTNFYKMSADSYNKLMAEAINKDYKKTNRELAKTINDEAKIIAQSLGIDDRVTALAEKEAFATLKDHKQNFTNKPTCRLINPTKSEIGKVSKQMLDSINSAIIDQTHNNLWKSTSSVISWFKKIEDKSLHNFIIFDIVDYYPSITEELMNKALNFAAKFTNISMNDRKVILHAKKTFLVHHNELWKKKNNNQFDVTMGSYDGAESCELVGLYLLSELKEEIKCGNFGLYRDDGLAVIKATPKDTEKIKKQLCKIFNKHGLRITVEANLKTVNYLDVTLKLNNGEYKPYCKPNNTVLYVSNKSNHPPSILQNIPRSINNRLNKISSKESAFQDEITPYQEALNKSHYRHKLVYERLDNNNGDSARPKNRGRKIIWYNPPYSKNIKTNIGRQFINLVKKCFPKNHKLNKIFNTNTIKISYSCMPNIKNIIDSHNKSTLSGNKEPERLCNCRRREECPMNGKCLDKSLIYQATVSTANGNSTSTYIGLTEGEFKTRFNNHTQSFRDPHKRTSTELSKHIWMLKEQNKPYTITWEKIANAKACQNGTSKCNLCLTEKYYIIFQPHLATLNERRDIVTSCRHVTKFILANNKKS